jgi:hypothetical protein
MIPKSGELPNMRTNDLETMCSLGTSWKWIRLDFEFHAHRDPGRCETGGAANEGEPMGSYWP